MPAIILDRDGVINYDSPVYIKSPAEWIPIPGSLEAIALLNQAGFQVYIATNQSGVARGLYDLATLSRIHDKLHRELEKVGGKVEEIFFCPHHPDEKCPCRKPQPGMIEQIQIKYQLDLSNTYFIGDQPTDIEVAYKAGCKPVLVLSGKGEKTLADYPGLLKDVPYFSDLAHAVNFVIG